MVYCGVLKVKIMNEESDKENLPAYSSEYTQGREDFHVRYESEFLTETHVEISKDGHYKRTTERISFWYRLRTIISFIAGFMIGLLSNYIASWIWAKFPLNW